MLSGGGPGLQSREGGNRIVPGGFDSHPFRLNQVSLDRMVLAEWLAKDGTITHVR